MAAVDVGILNLTRYEAPNPVGYFFGQKALGAEIRDLYGYLIDGMQGTLGAIRSGGDGGAAELADIAPDPGAARALFRRREGRARRHAPASASSSRPSTAPAGSWSTAWTKAPGRRGPGRRDRPRSRRAHRHAAALPQRRRPLALLRRARQRRGAGRRLHGRPRPAPARSWSAPRRCTGPCGWRPAPRARSSIPITAAGPGLTRLDLTLTGPASPAASARASRSRIGPAPARSCAARCGRWSPAPACSSRTTSSPTSCPAPARSRSPPRRSPALDVPALLQALDRYPYGCSEQTVSRAMPLLYVNRLAALDQLGLDDKADERVREAIDRVLPRQDSNGRFRPLGRRRRRATSGSTPTSPTS